MALASSRIRVAIGQFQELSEEQLAFARQLGACGVQLNTPRLPGETRWEYEDLVALRRRCDDAGLQLVALENTPVAFYDRAMLGLPGRDEQIENYRETIRNMGRAGIDILGFHWMPNGVWRTAFDTPGRGGSLVSSFDMSLVADGPPSHGRLFSEEELWDSFAYFLRAVLPVAEESGVRLALHPDDPPVPLLGGIPRLFRDFDSLDRAMEMVPSPNLGLDFCMGTWSSMGPGVIRAMEHFAPRGKIFYVHFRDVQGHTVKFQECHLGEGNVDVVEAMATLWRSGFEGFIIDDHVPAMVNDTVWGHRGRAHQTGVITGLLMAVQALVPGPEATASGG